MKIEKMKDQNFLVMNGDEVPLAEVFLTLIEPSDFVTTAQTPNTYLNGKRYLYEIRYTAMLGSSSNPHTQESIEAFILPHLGDVQPKADLYDRLAAALDSNEFKRVHEERFSSGVDGFVRTIAFERQPTIHYTLGADSSIRIALNQRSDESFQLYMEVCHDLSPKRDHGLGRTHGCTIEITTNLLGDVLEGADENCRLGSKEVLSDLLSGPLTYYQLSQLAAWAECVSFLVRFTQDGQGSVFADRASRALVCDMENYRLYVDYNLRVLSMVYDKEISIVSTQDECEGRRRSITMSFASPFREDFERLVKGVQEFHYYAVKKLVEQKRDTFTSHSSDFSKLFGLLGSAVEASDNDSDFERAAAAYKDASTIVNRLLFASL